MKADPCGRTGCLFTWTACVLFEVWSPLQTKELSFSQVPESSKSLLPFQDLVLAGDLFHPRRELTTFACFLAQPCRSWSPKLHVGSPPVMSLPPVQLKLGETISSSTCCVFYILSLLPAFHMLCSFSQPLACIPQCMQLLAIPVIAAAVLLGICPCILTAPSGTGSREAIFPLVSRKPAYNCSHLDSWQLEVRVLTFKCWDTTHQLFLLETWTALGGLWDTLPLCLFSLPRDERGETSILQGGGDRHKPPSLGASKPVPEAHSTHRYPKHIANICLK